MARYLITLCNPGGELDRRTAKTEEECRTAALDMIGGMSRLCDGDTISVVDLQPEE